MKNIKRSVFECIRLAFVVPQHMVVRLRLQMDAAFLQSFIPVTSEKPSSKQLVRSLPQAHPEEMGMVRHQAIGGAVEVVTGQHVKHEFPDRAMHRWVEPTGGTVVKGHRPVNPGMAPICGCFKPWQMVHGLQFKGLSGMGQEWMLALGA